MPILSASQIAQVAANAGFKGNGLVVAVAVALAESGGNTEAVDHDSNGSTDYGLWQINSVHGVTQSAMFDPVQNAAEAYNLSSGGSNWSPWVTFTTGAYVGHLPAAQSAVTGVVPGVSLASWYDPGGVLNDIGKAAAAVGNPEDAVGTVTGTAGLISSAEAAVNFVTNTGNWVRLAYILGGSGMVLFGIVELARNTDIGSKAISGAKDAAIVAAV